MATDDARDFDPHRFSEPAEAYQAYDRLRASCPVGHSDQHGGFFVLTRYDDVRAAAANHEVFSSATGHLMPEPGGRMLPPIDFDPPEHTHWRRVFRDLFDAPARRRVEAQVPVIADQLIDGFIEQGSCDLVADYAEPLPLLTIAHLVGLDAERAPAMHDLVIDMFAKIGDPAAFRAAGGAVAEFFLAEVNERRARPRDDYLTTLGRDEFGGAKLTDDELVAVCISLLGAGHHSTASALASLLHHVLGDDDVRSRVVADRGLTQRAVEETLRLDTPLHNFRRRTRAPATIGGVDIGADADVLLVFAAANRDPAVFTEPHTFDLNRRHNTHMAFGYGIHACVGTAIARMELRLALDRLLDRVPDVRPAEPAVRRGFVGGKLDMITELPVRFTPGR